MWHNCKISPRSFQGQESLLFSVRSAQRGVAREINVDTLVSDIHWSQPWLDEAAITVIA